MQESWSNEGLAASLLEAMSEAVYVVNPDREIMYWNGAAEKLTGFHAEEVLGHRCRDGILNHVDGQGRPLCATRCPLAGTLLDGRQRDATVWAHHRDGHRLPVAVKSAALRNFDGVIIGAVEVFHDDSRCQELAVAATTARALADLDALTGLANRRTLEREVDLAAERLERHGNKFAVLFIDVDHFKSINDSFGHQVGDDVLRMVARTLDGATRDADLVGRWGGEEFVIVAPGLSRKRAVLLGERVRRLVRTAWLQSGSNRIRVSVSIGVAQAVAGDLGTNVVARADRAMYRAKRLGRDRVIGDPIVRTQT